MVTSLKLAHRIDNLRLALKWIRRNPEAQYKNYSREVFQAYAISTEHNLKDLALRLTNNTYEPSNPIKIHAPKPSGIQRTITLLSIEDQIVYQALTNIVAEKLRRKAERRYFKSVFGHIYQGRTANAFYVDWRRSYSAFKRAVKSAYDDGLVFTASFDLTACYDSIDHHVLDYFLQEIGLEREFTDQLVSLLQSWTATSPDYA